MSVETWKRSHGFYRLLVTFDVDRGSHDFVDGFRGVIFEDVSRIPDVLLRVPQQGEEPGGNLCILKTPSA
jgi:hypothetical protein